MLTDRRLFDPRPLCAPAYFRPALTFHYAPQPNCRFNADADTSHRSGYALWAPVNLAVGLFKENALAAFRILARHWSSTFNGPAQTSNAVRQRSSFYGLIGPTVLRAAGEQRCCAKVPCALALLGCPSKGGQRTPWRRQSAARHRQVGALSFGSPRSVRAVACHAAGSIPQSWLAPPLLGISRKVG